MNQDKVVKQKIPCGFHQWLSGKTSICNAGDMVDSQVRTLGHEDPLEREMAIYSSILTWEIPLTEEPGGLQTLGLDTI